MRHKLIYFMPYVLICIFLGLISFNSFAQTGELQGKVSDADSGEGIPFANVSTIVNGTQVGVQTDFDGFYTLKPLPVGTYTIEVSYVGYQIHKTNDVLVEADKITFLDVKMKENVALLESVVIQEYKVPLLKRITKRSRKKNRKKRKKQKKQKSVVVTGSKHERVSKPLLKADKTATGATVTKQQIQSLPTRDVQSIAGNTAGVYEAGKESNIKDSKEAKPNNGKNPKSVDKKSEVLAHPNFENHFVDIQKEALSTFSIDVDKAYYSQLRSLINMGYKPNINDIRIEEMINYFNYQYPQPTNQYPFSINTEISQCPWENKHELVLIGLQGKKMDNGQLPPQNLVFLIDVSGSMSDANKLPLVQEAFQLLVQEMRPQDKVSIVTYAGQAGVALQPTAGNQADKINQAITTLRSGGSTAGAQGILTAYELAKKNFNRKGNNRVILATDGDFNVGVSSNEELVKLIEKERKYGIYLSVLGFGSGNYRDGKMEELSNHGNGNYAYIDNIKEAEKVLVKEMSGTLQTIARDVKLQIEFNPAKVAAFRLIGYQNRMLEKEDFNDQTVDAGEIGAGHSVTALYEIIPVGQAVPKNWQENELTLVADVQKEEGSEQTAEKTPKKAVDEQGSRKVDPLKYQLPKSEATANSQGKLQLSSAANTDEVLTVKVRYKSLKGKKHYKFNDVLKAPKSSQKSMKNASNNLKWASTVANFGLLLQNSRYKGNFAYKDLIKQAKKVVNAKKQAKIDVYYEQQLLDLIEQASKL